jgi:DNA-binding HxlR family transcriptional regulator
VDDARRSYEQHCPLARTLDLVGERWSLLIVRDLLLSPRRFTDLMAGLPGITTNLLTRKLKQMELSGLVVKERVPPPTPAVLYRLTERGQELESLIRAARDWGGKLLLRPGTGEHTDIGWVLPMLASRYRGGVHLLVELRVEGRTYRLELLPDEFNLQERDCLNAELVISGDYANVYEVFFGPATASEVVARGGVVVEGKFGRWPKLLTALELR